MCIVTLYKMHSAAALVAQINAMAPPAHMVPLQSSSFMEKLLLLLLIAACMLLLDIIGICSTVAGTGRGAGTGVALLHFGGYHQLDERCLRPQGFH